MMKKNSHNTHGLMVRQRTDIWVFKSGQRSSDYSVSHQTKQRWLKSWCLVSFKASERCQPYVAACHHTQPQGSLFIPMPQADRAGSALLSVPYLT